MPRSPTTRTHRRESSASCRLSLAARCRRVRLVLCDVDGVMTDGSVFMGPGGEFKQYNIPDGLGLLFLRRAGIKVGWISARPSVATELRAKDLQIDFIAQPTEGKVPAAEDILRQTRLKWEHVCYVGDDVLDLGMLKRAGLAVVPANGVAEARAAAHHVTRARGGHGAVREVAELILKAQNKWKAIVAHHSA